MRRGHGDGGIDARGDNVWRLRYRVSGKRHAKTFHGTKAEAQRELRRSLSACRSRTARCAGSNNTRISGQSGGCAIGAPGRRQKKVGNKKNARALCHAVTPPRSAQTWRQAATANPGERN